MAVLVAYATAHGSTKGVAERIATRLRGHGIEAVASPAGRVDDTAPFDAVVVGSAIHNGDWLPEAVAFTRAHVAALRARPLWLFSVSSIGEERSFFAPRIARLARRKRTEPKAVVAVRASGASAEHRNFAGAIEADHWGPVVRVLMVLPRCRYGDHREWPAIDAWADSIAAALLQGYESTEAGTESE